LRLNFDDTVYSLDTVKKAAYRLSDRIAIEISLAPAQIICDVSFSPPVGEAEQTAIIAAFRNELLDQDLRESIGRETTAVRNAVLAVAFSPVTARSD
jgi:His-Xaa-Ser system protein HxsD